MVSKVKTATHTSCQILRYQPQENTAFTASKLKDLAQLSDKYDCIKAVQYYVARWMEKLVVTVVGNESLLLTAYLIDSDDGSQALSQALIRHSTIPLMELRERCDPLHIIQIIHFVSESLK